MQTRARTTAPSLRLRFPARPESAFLLRQRLALWLDDVDAGSDDVFALSLAASEAFSNGVEHPHQPTRSFIEIDVSFVERVVTITIRDSGSWGGKRLREDGGYGFRLMRHLMDEVEVTARPEGTSIMLQRHIR